MNDFIYKEQDVFDLFRMAEISEFEKGIGSFFYLIGTLSSKERFRIWFYACDWEISDNSGIVLSSQHKLSEKNFYLMSANIINSIERLDGSTVYFNCKTNIIGVFPYSGNYISDTSVLFFVDDEIVLDLQLKPINDG